MYWYTYEKWSRRAVKMNWSDTWHHTISANFWTTVTIFSTGVPRYSRGYVLEKFMTWIANSEGGLYLYYHYKIFEHLPKNMPSFMDAPPIAYKYCQIYWRVNWLSWSNFQKLFVKSCNFFCRLVHCVRQEEDDEGNTDCRTTSHFTNQIERLVFYKARPFYRRKNQQNGLAYDMLI